MSDPVLQAAQAVSILGAAFLSGFIACFSHAGVPTLSIAPVDVLVHEFKIMYNIGKSTSPGIAVAVTVCNVVAAVKTRQSETLVAGLVSPFVLYVAAALCVPSIVPYTLLVMEPGVNAKLIGLGEKAEKGIKADELGASEHEVKRLLVQWKSLNFNRAVLVGAGAVLAVLATLA